jgi:hypothetical protein
MTQYSQHPGFLGTWHTVDTITPNPTQKSSLVLTKCKIRFPEKQTVTTLPPDAVICQKC